MVDLDPGPPAGLAECCLVAVAARHRLALDGLAPFAKTSGKKGMQLLCRIARRPDLGRGRRLREAVAEDLERALPELVTARMTKSLRPGKVFFDWSQNVAAKTTVSRLLAAGRPDADRLRAVHLGRGRSRRGAPAPARRGAGPDGRHGDLLAGPALSALTTLRSLAG